MSHLHPKLGIYSQILTPSAISTALAVWPGVYWLSDGSLFQYFSFQYWTTNHPGKHTFATSFFACTYIFPFVKLASCAELISSISVFVPFELCFLLAPHSSEFLNFIYLMFEFIFLFFPSFFIWPCSGRWCSRKHIRKQSLWESHLLIISAQSCKVSCALHASVFRCLWGVSQSVP